MNEHIHCLLEIKCRRGTGVCCFKCAHSSDCDDSCTNHPKICNISVMESLMKRSSFSGSRLLALRKRAGIELDDFAKRVNTIPSYAQTWETGERKPYRKMQDRICSVIGCSLADLRE